MGARERDNLRMVQLMKLEKMKGGANDMGSQFGHIEFVDLVGHSEGEGQQRIGRDLIWNHSFISDRLLLLSQGQGPNWPTLQE